MQIGPNHGLNKDTNDANNMSIINGLHRRSEILCYEEGNVLMSVLACLPFCDEKSMNVPFPPINKEASTNYLILKGQLTPANDDDDKEVLTDDDVRVVSKAVTSWALSMFQHAASSGIQKLINIQYGYRYDDRIGLNLSLECCYNMTTDIQDNCIETLSGYTSVPN